MKVLKPAINLYSHQKLSLNLMNTHNRYGLYLEMGLGKTLIGLSDIVRKIHINGARKILVVATKSIIAAWQRDMQMLTDQARALVEKYVTFTNYEQLVDRKYNVDGKKVVKRTENGSVILDTKWDYIIFDECQKLKDHNSSTHKNSLKIAYRAKYVYLLTGSPVVNGQLINYHAYDLFLNPTLYRGRIVSAHWGGVTKFKNDFGILDQWYNIKVYTNVDKILNYVKTVSVRMYSKDYLDLPDMLEPEIWEVEMTKEQEKIYKEMAKSSTIESEEIIAENPASRLNYLRQIASGFYYRHIENDGETGREAISLSLEKAKLLQTYLSETDDPLVIFYNYDQELKDIVHVLQKLKVKHLILNGNTKPKDKGNWRIFQEDDSVRVYVAQISAGARGIDLYKSSKVLYYSLPLSSEVFEQSKKRINRIGTKHPSSYFIFASKGSIEYAIYQALQNYLDFNKVMFSKYITTYEKGMKIKK